MYEGTKSDSPELLTGWYVRCVQVRSQTKKEQKKSKGEFINRMKSGE